MRPACPWSARSPITLFNDNDRSDLSDLATLTNGNFVAVFESPFQGSATDLNSFFTIKTETGANVVSPTTVAGAGSSATETDPHVAALAGGGFVVTWTDSAGDEGGMSQGILATVYDANGAVVPGGGDILVNQFNQAGTQQSNDVTALPDGGFVVAWEDLAAAVDRAQRFNAAGHPIGTPVTIATLATFNINAATLANDRPIFTINDFSSGNTNTDSSILLYPQPDDFNGDGFADVLLQNANGQVAIWEMNGTNQIPGGVAAAGPNPGTNWKAVGAGDFNGDGDSDVLLQNTNGQVAIWEMNGTNQIPGGVAAAGPNPGTNWKAVGAGDFNGDGDSDVLLQNVNGQVAIWEMNGTNQIPGGVAAAGPNPGTNWKAVGTDDFNGDGFADVLLQNVNGQVAIWEMNGTNQIPGGVAAAGPNPGTNWKAVGTGDFNGDGDSDILLQNTNGQVAIWEMNGTNQIPGGVVAIGPNPGTNWKAVGARDFNGDGFADILFQNTSGQVAIWEMNGTNVIARELAGPNPGTSWHTVKT